MVDSYPKFLKSLRILGGVIATVVALILTPYMLGMLVTWVMPTDTTVRRLIYVGALLMGSMAAVVVWNTFVLRKHSAYGFGIPCKWTFLALIVGVMSSVTVFTVAVLLNNLEIIHTSVPLYEPIVMALAIASYTAVSEEVLSRHIVISAVMCAFKSAPLAQLVQVAFFVSQHPQANPLLIASAALLLGQIYILSKSFVVPAAMHFGFNFSQEMLYSGYIGYVSNIANTIDRNTVIAVFNLLCVAVIYSYNFVRTSRAAQRDSVRTVRGLP